MPNLIIKDLEESAEKLRIRRVSRRSSLEKKVKLVLEMTRIGELKTPCSI